MLQNKIDGERKLPNFWFKNCYYVQLLVAGSCLGIDSEDILLNYFTLVHDDFALEEIEQFTEQKLFEMMGFRMQKKCLSANTMVKNVDKGAAQIVGLDAYYLESRPDTYLKMHAPHYLFLYGYDLQKDIAFVVDQDYTNSCCCKEKEISFSNLVYANKMLRKVSPSKKRESRVISKQKGRNRVAKISPWRHITKARIMNSYEASKRNLTKLIQIFGSEEETLRAKIERINDYFKYLKQFYCILSKTKVFGESEQAHVLTHLESAYGVLLAMSWRIRLQEKFSLSETQKSAIVRKLHEIYALEDIVYADIGEKANG